MSEHTAARKEAENSRRNKLGLLNMERGVGGGHRDVSKTTEKYEP
jgi:hypothetical protein